MDIDKIQLEVGHNLSYSQQENGRHLLIFYLSITHQAQEVINHSSAFRSFIGIHPFLKPKAPQGKILEMQMQGT